MAELDDELDALRQADPVEAATVPSSDSPAALALFERITMTGIDRADVDAGATPKGPDRPRRWVAVAGAAAALVVVLTAIGIAVVRSGDGGPTQVAPTSTTSPGSTEPGSGGGPISPGAASCVELYSLETLAHRDVAFDGTVESVDGDDITFTVNQWFRGGEGGGEGDEVVRRGASTLGGFTSVGDPVNLEPGRRLLVAGDDDFAWGCGFTQTYDPDVAAVWATTLAD